MNMAAQYHEDILAEMEEHLKATREQRKPNTRGIMLLTAFLGSLMLRGGEMTKPEMDSAELLFWITHNGDGTLITPQVKPV